MITYANHLGIRSPHPVPRVDYNFTEPLPFLQPENALVLLLHSLAQSIDTPLIDEVVEIGMACKDCGEPFSPERFYYQPARGRYLCRCKLCHRAKIKQYADNKREVRRKMLYK